MAEFQVRLAAASDHEGLIAILRRMEQHYDAAFSCDEDTARRRIGAAMFGPRPAALAFIAVEAGETVGIAVCNYLFPTADFRLGIYLKDVFVDAAARNRGIGRALIGAVIGHAAAGGFARVDWTTETDNQAAAHLYRALGAKEVGKHYFRVREGDYDAFLAPID
ncbi:MAG: GNAT family N-acetyltransferase [Alphaproteobacteria bacterium]|nr:GNAT family N-acetyltransferase [Alphaproteobacteria bacterium]